jgi:cobalt-precorrin-5B (C1)-methyltransferase
MKRLRSGFTTGACAAAASKGAVTLLLGRQPLGYADIPFPDGRRVSFALASCGWQNDLQTVAMSSVIKDAGDDPDVTNGAEIVATAHLEARGSQDDANLRITGGKGVGTVTKPGLALPVGSPAINPVPLMMIEQAVTEALQSVPQELSTQQIVVTISIPNGEELAHKTLNKRLGIIGGLSILGTTGVVVPVSAEAWTATIAASMDVALECGVKEIVLSTGRTSERAVEEKHSFPEEALIMMGDYVEFSLKQAAARDFTKIHLAGMWAKLLKGALRIPQTHVRHGALDVERAICLLHKLAPDSNNLVFLQGSNTAREIYERLIKQGSHDLIKAVCREAKEYYQTLCGLPVQVYLVNASGKIVVTA